MTIRARFEQRFRRIEIARRLDEVGAVDVGHETKRHGTVAVLLERFICHHRPEVGPTDADIEDVADVFAAVAFPLAAADAVGEAGHLAEHGVNLGHDVLAVDDHGCTFWRPPRHVQDSPIFCDVYLLAAEHGVDPRAQPGSRARSRRSLSVSLLTRFFE